MYKRILILVLLMSLAVVASTSAGNRWPIEENRDHKLQYRADTVARLCFALDKDYFPAFLVPCENLARRPGWDKIITWVEPAGIKWGPDV